MAERYTNNTPPPPTPHTTYSPAGATHPGAGGKKFLTKMFYCNRNSSKSIKRRGDHFDVRLLGTP